MKNVKKFLVGGMLIIGLFGIIGNTQLVDTALKSQEIANPGPSRIVVRA
ncbi:hypothetical protein [Clostridium senegalense]|nr:hypothetical protein [Clostridium senegalense]